MRRIHRRSLALVALAALIAVPVLAAPAAAANPRSEHDRIVGYWTKERIANARPRDFVRTPAGELVLRKPVAAPGGSGSLDDTRGRQWPDGVGKIYTTVGRVLFTMDRQDWICSGVAATDPHGTISVVLTAAHCAYDNQGKKAFATNWTFFPEFDTSPQYSCTTSTHGCWTASRIVVHNGYASQRGFTTTATLHDWAFAVMRTGGKSGGQLDGLGSWPISFTSYASGTQQSAFGYPGGAPYNGLELIYCDGPAGFDPNNANRTYRLPCDMTGGSSGGPWLVNFDASGSGSGTLSSVNSYGYNGVVAMHGPKFNSSTAATWNNAINTSLTGNAIVP
jgi:hypothetical protein